MKNNLLFLLLFGGIIGCADDDISGSVYGTVSTEDGVALTNTAMSLYKLERYYRNGTEYGKWIVEQQKKTDDNGYYEFEELSPVENYQLKAELKEYAIFSSDIGFLKSERMNINIFLEKVKVDTSSSIILKEAGIAVQKLDISAGAISQKLAERLCAESIVGGQKDWRLPTLSELTSMYNNKLLLPNIKEENSYYWTSTLESGVNGQNRYYLINMRDGDITDNYSNSSSTVYYYKCYARCVRSIE